MLVAEVTEVEGGRNDAEALGLFFAMLPTARCGTGTFSHVPFFCELWWGSQKIVQRCVRIFFFWWHLHGAGHWSHFDDHTIWPSREGLPF